LGVIVSFLGSGGDQMKVMSQETLRRLSFCLFYWTARTVEAPRLKRIGRELPLKAKRFSAKQKRQRIKTNETKTTCRPGGIRAEQAFELKTTVFVKKSGR